MSTRLLAYHTHTRLTALCPGLLGPAGTRKVKPIWILLKQETVSGSGISWAICKSAHRSRQITTPAPHHSCFLQADALPAAQPTASKHHRLHSANTRPIVNDGLCACLYWTQTRAVLKRLYQSRCRCGVDSGGHNKPCIGNGPLTLIQGTGKTLRSIGRSASSKQSTGAICMRCLSLTAPSGAYVCWLTSS